MPEGKEDCTASVKASNHEKVKPTDGLDGEQLEQRLLWREVLRYSNVQLNQAVHGDGDRDGDDDGQLR